MENIMFMKHLHLSNNLSIGLGYEEMKSVSLLVILNL